MDYDVVVIGAGNGGLTAACSLAQRSKNIAGNDNVPGGCATSFAGVDLSLKLPAPT